MLQGSLTKNATENAVVLLLISCLRSFRIDDLCVYKSGMKCMRVNRCA